jgi:hypothetical protein
MKVATLVLLAGIVLLFGTACNSVPLDAEKAANDYWNKVLTTCPDHNSWGEVFGGVVEYKDFDFTTDNLDVSDVDKMNGMEWRIKTNVKPGTAYRIWNPFWKRFDRDWTESQPGAGSMLAPGSVAVRIEKANGKVTYNGILDSALKLQRYNCSALPAS